LTGLYKVLLCVAAAIFYSAVLFGSGWMACSWHADSKELTKNAATIVKVQEAQSDLSGVYEKLGEAKAAMTSSNQKLDGDIIKYVKTPGRIYCPPDVERLRIRTEAANAANSIKRPDGGAVSGPTPLK